MGRNRTAGDIVGDYRLTEAVSDGALTRTWKAEQISIQRDVMLEMLKREPTADIVFRIAFLADVRAKAAASHPIIGAVYEAHNDDEATFYARERLRGENLDSWIERGKKLTPLEVVILMEQIGDSQLYLETASLATVPLAAHHIVIDGSALRIMNLVADGPRSEDQSTADKQLLGALFDELLIPGEPGSTRVSSLLAYMADLQRPIPLTWTQIRDLSRQVIDQLEGNDASAALPEVDQRQEEIPKSRTPYYLLIAAVISVAVLASLVITQGEKVPEKEKQTAIEPVEIAPGLRLSAHEVTIAQYRAFLDSLAQLPARDRSAFDHPEQPAEKTDHLPSDWKKLSAAAAKGGVWNGRLVSDGCPVVGIDWWDAHAFATWQGGRLPTAAEWEAAAQATEAIAGWGKASSPERDRSESGLIGMAGNVMEWTRDSEINPAHQLRPKAPLACGGSFLKPSTGITARTWLESRNARSEDLGFRTLFEKK